MFKLNTMSSRRKNKFYKDVENFGATLKQPKINLVIPVVLVHLRLFRKLLLLTEPKLPMTIQILNLWMIILRRTS